MKLLLSISLFLAAVIDSHGRVSDNFDNCQKYFYKTKIPSGFKNIAKDALFNLNDLPDGIDVNEIGSPAYICQTYEDSSWFATLYDRGRRMPLYSAYIMDVKTKEASKECARTNSFQLEPQLAYREVTENMVLTKKAKEELGKYNKQKHIDERKEKNRPYKLLQTSQAIDDDYKTDYDRGHLTPCGHQSAKKDGYKATFTLTNVVPMVKDFNNKIWSQYENEMVQMTTQCKDVYVITGIVPGNVPIKADGLTLPFYVWNAYCCVDNNDKPFMSGAALAENIKDSKIKKFQNIGDFQAELKNLLRVDIQLFEGNCKP